MLMNTKQEELAALLPKTRVWEDWKGMWRSYVLRYMLDEDQEEVVVVLSIPNALRASTKEKLRIIDVAYDTPTLHWSMYIRDDDTTPIVVRSIDVNDREEQNDAWLAVRNALVDTYEPDRQYAKRMTKYIYPKNMRKRHAPHMDRRKVKHVKNVHENCLVIDDTVLWFNDRRSVYTRGEYLATAELTLMKITPDRTAIKTIMSYLY